MNKKVIIWGAVAVGAILLYRHMKATKAAELAKQAATAETSNASGTATAKKCQGGGNYPTPGTIANCESVCDRLNGSWNADNLTCTASWGANVPAVFGGMGRQNR